MDKEEIAQKEIEKARVYAIVAKEMRQAYVDGLKRALELIPEDYQHTYWVEKIESEIKGE